MDLTTSQDARNFIQKKINSSPKEQALIIYQYNKQSCIDSYLDYVIEIDSKESILKLDIYENWKNLGNELYCNIDVYIEKRLREEWQKTGTILLDIEVIYKFNEKYESLILREAEH